MIVLAGQSHAGKSSIARTLAEMNGWPVASAREILHHLGKSQNRRQMQEFGWEVESGTQGAWLANGVRDFLAAHRTVVVDSARTQDQVNAIRALGDTKVRVVFVRATRAARLARFERKHGRDTWEVSSFETIEAHPSERSAQRIQPAADFVVDTTNLSPAEASSAVSVWLDSESADD